METSPNIRPKDRDAIIQSLRAGVVPRVGQQHIQVGRLKEVESLNRDLERIGDGGSSLRFIIGEYGAGKTFFLFLIRSIAMQKKLITVHADLTPDRRLQSTGGQARNLYSELMKNMATRSKPDGNALGSVVERFVSGAVSEAKEKGCDVGLLIHEKLRVLEEMVGGYDFAEVLVQYWKGFDSGNDRLMSDAIRWLRGEFSTRTDARNALGVRTIIDDASFYDQLKLMARFVRMAGYGGLLVNLDEMVNLYKITNSRTRNANYEQVLRILNDCLQGSAEGLGFLLGGTPEFVTDTRRGLYSYQALQSRLAENTFAVEGLTDLTGPVIRLSNLSPEDIYLLLTKLRGVYCTDARVQVDYPDEAIQAFMQHCSGHVGEAYFRTPRNTIRGFLDLLSMLEQHPEIPWNVHLSGCRIEVESAPVLADINDDEEDQLVSFKL
jgi:hypothetical protein